MPHTVEFTVRSSMFADALSATRDAVGGRGFDIVEETSGGFVAERGSRRLTAFLGSFVPRGRQFVRLRVDGRHRPLSRSVLVLRAAESGGASGGGPLADRRRGEIHRWVADGIERALTATGAFVSRFDHGHR